MHFKQMRIEAWKSQEFNGVWTRDLAIPRCDSLTNWAMKPLTLGGGHLWVLMSSWRMDVKWYMKCFIYWTTDLKSNQIWSSQLWTQFKQLRIEAWKSQDFNTTVSYGIITNLKCARLGTKIQNHYLFVPRKKNSSSNAVVQLWGRGQQKEELM